MKKGLFLSHWLPPLNCYMRRHDATNKDADQPDSVRLRSPINAFDCSLSRK